jgi:type IV pilus assembly protein PilQ
MQITGCRPKLTGTTSRLRVLALLATLLMAAPVWAQTVLEGITYSTGSGGSVEVILNFSGDYPEPEIFTTDNPARIALDLAGVANGMTERSLSVGSGATRSVTAVEAGGRTRVVVDLFRSAPFDTRREGTNLILAVSGGGASTMASQARALPDSTRSTVSRGALSVTNVDFRRGRGGEGRVVLAFNEPGASVDLSKQGERIELTVHDAAISSELEQRLDVVDFATPVDMIDTRASSGNVRMTITVSGAYEHIAYQAGNQYVIEFQEYQPPQLTLEEQALQKPEYEGTKVTFNFQDIPVRAVLQLIADVSSLNVVVSDSVQGNVTLRLQNVPWDQALDIVLMAKALGQEKNGNVIWIAPAQEIADNKSAKLAALQEQRRLEPVRSAYIQVNYADAGDLSALIQEAKSASAEEGSGLLSDRGSVTVDERTNVLLVTDTDDRLSEIRELVTLLDRPVQQVQIESRIVVANDNFSDELGVRFGLSAGHNDSHDNLLTTSGSLVANDAMNNVGLANRLPLPWGGGLTPDGSSTPVFVSDDAFGPGVLVPALGDRLNVNLPASPTAARFAWSILTSDYLLDLELSALESEGRGEVVSSPRLITANQTEAFIQQGTEIPFQQDSSSGATNIQFKEAVLELKVTPLVTPDDRVILDLHVKKDTVGDLVPTEGGGLIPSIDTREIKTQVLVDSGQTVVLGGIYEQTRRNTNNKVPFLGDLPGLGMFFRQRTSQNDKAELLIFVTPTILVDNVGYN